MSDVCFAEKLVLFSLQQRSQAEYHYKSWLLMRWFHQPILMSQKIINRPTHHKNLLIVLRLADSIISGAHVVCNRGHG